MQFAYCYVLRYCLFYNFTFQDLAKILYEAAEDNSYINPNKIQEILGVSQEETLASSGMFHGAQQYKLFLHYADNTAVISNIYFVHKQLFVFIIAVCIYRYVITFGLRSKYDMDGHYFRFMIVLPSINKFNMMSHQFNMT